MCSELGREVDASLLSELEAANKAELAKLEEGIEEATKNFGETEQRDALMAKAEYLCKIGDKVREEIGRERERER
jgi:26S proteasome regulatory subunit N7